MSEEIDMAFCDRHLEGLFKRKEELEKKRIQALSMGVGQPILDQLNSIHEQIEIDIIYYHEKKNLIKSQSDDQDDSDDLIV